MAKTAYLYVFDTMADWEPAFLISELNSGRYFKKNTTEYQVTTLGISNMPITTMGGIRIVPDITVDDFTVTNASLLILPGGNTWLEAIHKPIFNKVNKCLQSGILVAAICGATFGLAEAGFLNSRAHTSNDINYLKAICPNYKGEKYYRFQSAVRDGNLITASGIAPLEFAFQVLKYLDVFSSQTLEAWFNLYKTQEAKYFYALLESLKVS
jgi:putative intracellular protease/amidase